MILDNLLTFASAQAITGAADSIATNVYDAGSAKKMHQGAGRPLKIAITVSAIGGTTPTFRARYVAADNAALTTNPEILDDTGTSAAIVAATDLPLVYELIPSLQKTTKQYYGVIFTLGGTTPTATVNAAAVADAQSNGLK